MPHIRAICCMGNEGRKFLATYALTLRSILAGATGYSRYEIAVIPEHIPVEDITADFNLDPIEFVLDVGTLVDTPEKAKRCAMEFRNGVLKRCPETKKLKFGVWARSLLVNEFVGHNPASTEGRDNAG